MEFEKAVNSLGEVITFAEIKNSTNLKILRDNLKCPTKGCEAKLSYIAARHPYLKTHNNSIHSNNCPHKKENIEVEKRQKRRKQLVNLDESGVYSRLDGFTDDFYPNEKSKINKPKTSTKHKSKSKAIDNAQDAKPQGVASVNSGISDSKDVISPRVSKKHLNEFISSDQGGIFQVGARLKGIKKINNKKYIFKISDPKSDCYGEILLKDQYFSRNIQGINDQLDFLMNYLENKSNNDINIAYYGTLITFKTKRFEVFVDYGFKLYLMKKDKVRKYTLAEFYYEHSN